MKVRVWLRRLAGVLVFLIVLSYAFSFALRGRRLHRYLERRLEASFGRPVEVGRFAFSLLAGPRLEAERVTVGEDPAFGYEYFLRAERLTAGLRWGQLLRGRFEFGTLFFTRPSLNLVRDSDGRWNIERWLPPRTSGPAQASPGGVTRLYRIEFETGRINLKYGTTKQLFALVDVDGSVEQEGRGRWRLDLQAQPARAGVRLQEVGLVRVRGRIAGTSARLQPAEIILGWEDASLADVLRLARGQDFGVRGRFGLELTARTAPGEPAPGEPAKWQFALHGRISRVHRWDISERPDNPAVSLKADAGWDGAQGRLELTQVVLEAPRSQIRAAGEVAFVPWFEPRLRWESAGVHLGDLLAWLRAFQPGVADGLNAEAHVSGSAMTRGWPPRLERGEAQSRHGSVIVPGLAGPIQWSSLAATAEEGRIEVLPARLSFAGPVLPPSTPGSPPAKIASARGPRQPAVENAVEIAQATYVPGRSITVHVLAHLVRAEDVLAIAAAMGRPANRGWDMRGEAFLDVFWTRPAGGPGRWSGRASLKNTRLSVVGLNQLIQLDEVALTAQRGSSQVKIANASAFGASWSGALWKNGGRDWQFRLHADRLSDRELDRWLGPRARPGWLERLLPGLLGAGRTAVPSAASQLLRSLRAEGELSVDEFALGALQLTRLRGLTVMGNSRVSVTKAEAELAGGRVQGNLGVSLAPKPRYQTAVTFDGVNLAALVQENASLRDLLGGQASGELRLSALGIGRQELLASLDGEGKARLSGAEFRGLDLAASLSDGTRRAGRSGWAEGAAEFSIQAGAIQMNSLQLRGMRGGVLAKGTVSFDRVADLKVEPLPGRSGDVPSAHSPHSLRLAGPVEALRVTFEEAKPLAAQAN